MGRFIERVFGGELRKRLNQVAASCAGFLFFAGWWLMIDVHATNVQLISNFGVYYLPGLFMTIGFLLVLIVPKSALNSDDFYSNHRWPRTLALLMLFAGFFCCFSALIAACYMFVSAFVMTKYERGSLNGRLHEKIYPGVGILLQNVFIMAATFVYKFAIKYEEF